MAQFIKHFVQDLQQDIKIRQCGTIVFNKDNESNVISVDLYNGQEEYSGGGSVAGACICPDGSTVPLTGSISGKTASVTLTGDCFAFPGQIGIGIQVVSGTTKTTVLKAIYNVELFETDDMVDPGSRITASVGQLVADIEAATAEIPASDMASLMSGIAPTFSASTNYASGAYVYYSGTLYRFTSAHAAGSWTGTDATQVDLGNDLGSQVSNLKSALTTANVVQTDDKLRTTKGFYIDTTTKTWKVSSPSVYSIIKVKAGEYLKLTARNKTTYIAVMKSYTQPVADDTAVDYSDATGFTTLITVNSNTTYEATLPADAEYLYIFLGNSSTVRTPNSVKINNYDYALPLFDNLIAIVNGINSTIDGLDSHLDTLDSTYIVQTASASDYSNLLSHIVSVGVYYFSNNQGFTDRPQYIRSDVGATMTVSFYASTIVKQEIINAKGQKATRLVTISNYTPYTNNIGVDGNGWFYNVNSRWANKKIVCFGDSRTWYDGQTYNANTKSEIRGTTCVGYQQQMRILLGAILTNEGVSGDKSTQICDRIREYNFSTFDAVLLEGGVNDYIKSSSVTIGEIAPIGSTFDTTTVYGAWQSAIEYLMTNYPKVKIFITVPAIAWDDDNSMGTVFPYNVASIKKEIAELYMLPVLDLYKTAGITTINRDTFYCDDISSTGWRLHFNNDGNVLIGQMIAKYIEAH